LGHYRFFLWPALSDSKYETPDSGGGALKKPLTAAPVSARLARTASRWPRTFGTMLRKALIRAGKTS
jgi:hypothetical protein